MTSAGENAFATSPSCCRLVTLMMAILGNVNFLQWAPSGIKVHPLPRVPQQSLTVGAVALRIAPVFITPVRMSVADCVRHCGVGLIRPKSSLRLLLTTIRFKPPHGRNIVEWVLRIMVQGLLDSRPRYTLICLVLAQWERQTFNPLLKIVRNCRTTRIARVTLGRRHSIRRFCPMVLVTRRTHTLAPLSEAMLRNNIAVPLPK